MLSVEELYRLPVFEPRAGRRQTKGKDAQAAPAQRRLGRVHFPVFSPDGRRLVGLLVSRPDVAGMVKREDVFCAWDRVGTCERGLLVEGEAAMDAAAIERLGLDWDRCIIWSGMDVATVGGKAMGRVADLEVDPEGEVQRILVTDGDWAESFVGAVPVTMDLVRGIRNHTMIVADEVDDLELTGGWVAAAGRGFGTAKVKAGEALSKAGATAGTLVDKGSFALGRALGNAKRSIQEALADDDEDETVAAAAPVAAKAGAVVAEEAKDEATSGPIAAEIQAAGEGIAASESVPEPASSQDTASELEPESKATSTSEATPEPAATAPPKSKAEPEPKPKSEPSAHPSTGDPVADLARAFGRQLGKTQGMFGAFLREFKENSR